MAKDVLTYANSKYGSHVWMMYCGWGSYEAAIPAGELKTAMGSVYGPNLRGGYQFTYTPFIGKTTQIFEVGFNNYFGYDSDGRGCGQLASGAPLTCKWGADRQAAIDHNQLALTMATDGGYARASAICLQSDFYSDRVKYPMSLTGSTTNLGEIQSRLAANLEKDRVAGVYPPRQLPEGTARIRCGQRGEGCCDGGRCETGLNCLSGRVCVDYPVNDNKVRGDANGDKAVDLIDLQYWKAEYLGNGELLADFYQDKVIDFKDLGVWKTEYLRKKI